MQVALPLREQGQIPQGPGHQPWAADLPAKSQAFFQVAPRGLEVAPIERDRAEHVQGDGLHPLFFPRAGGGEGFLGEGGRPHVVPHLELVLDSQFIQRDRGRPPIPGSTGCRQRCLRKLSQRREVPLEVSQGGSGRESSRPSRRRSGRLP
jgi:hypothetical protein